MTEGEYQADQLSEQELRALIPQLQELTEKYKRTEVIQRALFNISELASSVSELPRLYPALHEIVGSFMNARNFYVAFYDDAREFVNFVYMVDQFDDAQSVQEIPAEQLKNGLTGYVLRHGEALFITKENIQKQLQDLNVKRIGANPVDWIGVPLKRGTQVIGVMAVQSYDDSERYGQDDLDVLLFISQHIVTTVDRVKSRELTERTIRERTKQLRTINDELQEEIQERQRVELLKQALFEISELSATVKGEVSEFYRSLHSILASLIYAPNCYIATLDEERNYLEFPYFCDEIAEMAIPRPLGRGLTEYLLRHGKAELVNNNRALELAQANELDEELAQSMVDNGNSWIGSPLIIDDKVIGVVGIQSYNDYHRYTKKDLELLQFVSHHIAVAFQRKAAADAIEIYNKQLAEKVTERTEELRQTNNYLKKQIEERKEIEQRLIHDAHHDTLTGLPNRAMFSNRLELALANKKRYNQNNFALLFIDLDRFKLINDTLGHHAGDQFLIEVSIRINACVRSHDLLARLGGDEFVILLDNFDSKKDVEDVAARIIQSLGTPFQLDGTEMYSGGSIGIAYVEAWYDRAEELIRDADAAMYQAKSSGRGRFVAFDQSMRDRLLEDLDLENEFRKTLKARSFPCHYQPVVKLSNNCPLYVECYIRWVHPSKGKIRRARFLQVAENSGLTLELDHFMFGNVCNMLKSWQEAGGEVAKRIVAMNLSTNHLMQSRSVIQLVEAVQQADIDASKLVLEIDESGLNRNPQFIMQSLQSLKSAGITLVLDNFGSGIAPLNYLCSYPFDYVKFDHTLVQSITHSDKNRKLLESVQVMSGLFGFGLIAEGIETEEQLAAVMQCGCTYGQGTFLNKPTVIDLEELGFTASEASQLESS